jgi:hypothetical protein
MTTCPNGHENPEHYRHCGQCGVPIAPPSSSALPAQPQGQWHPANSPSPSPPVERWSAPTSGRSSGGWRTWPVGAQIGAIAAVLVVIAGVGLAIGLSRSGTTGTDRSGLSEPSAAPQAGGEDAGSQSMPSSFALPSQVDQWLTNHFQEGGHQVEYPHCTYFAAKFGPPPVYDCSFKIDGIWHDQIEGTGHPDGSFSWQDDTSGVSPIR